MYFFSQSRGGQTIWYKKAGGARQNAGGARPTGPPRTLRAWLAKSSMSDVVVKLFTNNLHKHEGTESLVGEL